MYCENSTGGTTLDLRRSPQHPQCTQRILPGLQDAVVQISAIFEGYGRTELKVIIDEVNEGNNDSAYLPILENGPALPRYQASLGELLQG